MIPSPILFISVCILPTALHVACRPRTRDADIQALNELQMHADSAIVTGSTDRYLALLTPDAVLMPPNESSVVGRTAIRSWSEAMSRRARIQEYQPRDEEVVVAGNWAFRRGSFEWTVVLPGSSEPLRDHGKFIIIYQRGSDGAWLIARDIWSSSSPPR